MKKQIIDTSKYPITLKTSKTLGKKCWVKVRKSNGVFYKEDMWFTFETVVKDYRRHLKLTKTNPTNQWIKPYKEIYEVFECEIVKKKQILFK